jgi:hypothetical protein
MPTRVGTLASRPESLNPGAISEPVLDRSPGVVPLDRDALLARFDGIRQFARDRWRLCKRSYGPWGSAAHVSYPYGRLVNDGLWHLPARAQLLDAKGDVREGVARERDAPAGFTPDVLATFEREPDLIDVVALHLLESHFAPERSASSSAPRSPLGVGI